MLTSFQAILEKQTTLVMEAFQKTMESVLSPLSNIFEMGNRVTPHCGKKKAVETLAICQALDDLVESNVNLLVLSDSLSVLSALQNFSIKSNKIWKYVLFNSTIMPPKRSATGRSTKQKQKGEEKNELQKQVSREN
ncbi:hypothetical protein TNCV_4495081 [Trichonephila clavipes]|nr:hypothetical protein TNCV_4495081 [Trichonephila clavipes]